MLNADNSSQTTRREFLATSAVAGAGLLASPGILRAAEANSKLNVAFIGVGGRGLANLNTMTSDKDVNVVAVCDVNKQNLERAAARFPQAQSFVDFRTLYDETKDFDAVVVSVAEHTHAYATLPALKRKKPVYCEKPLTYNIHEARVIADAAREANVPTQMGTQIHGMPNYRRVTELIQSGVIGPVTEVHVWVSRAWGRQSADAAKAARDIVHVTERPTETVKPPAYLDWDLWLGPAPARPFHPVYFPGPKWYRWWDFGNGTMSDLGSHWVDLPWWAMKLDAPKTVEAFGPPAHPEIAPASMTVRYEYGPRGKQPACSLMWYQGVDKPEIWKNKGIPQWGNGVLFIGKDGMLLSDYGKYLLLPEDKFKDVKLPESFIPPSPGQHQQWLNACKTGSPTDSPFATYAGPLTEANHLGNVAYRAGEKVEWDTKNMRVTNTRAADAFVKREPREGWVLE